MEADAPIELPGKQPRSRIASGLSEIVKTLFLAAIIFVVARALILPYEVEGSSMAPNLHDQERVLVNQTVYYHFDLNRIINLLPGEDHLEPRYIYPFHAPDRGDIIVLNPPVRSDKPYIKRVIGLPGETITFRNGRVYIDGEQLTESYLNGIRTTCSVGPYCDLGLIPDGHVFVLGDNRDNSTDSRMFGPVAIAEIVGEAWFTNWPLSDFGRLPHYEY